MRIKEQIQAEIEKLQQELESLKQWPLPQGTKYHWYDSEGVIHPPIATLLLGDPARALSRERAKQLYKRAMLDSQMNLWADKYYPEGGKYYLFYHGNRVVIGRDVNASHSAAISQVYLPTNEAALQMREVFRDQITEVYS